MKYAIRVLIVFITILFANPCLAQTEVVNIGIFNTTGGSLIEDCKVGFRTIGSINSDSSNIVIWPCWFGGTSNVSNTTISKFLDTTSYFIVIVDPFGNGISSSPSNHSNFPNITITDMVNSQYKLLNDHLKISKVNTILGISMGGNQAFQWLVSYPEYMDKIVSICGTPKPSFSDVLVLSTMKNLIEQAGTDSSRLLIANRRCEDIMQMTRSTPSFLTRTQDVDDFEDYMNANYSNLSNPLDFLSQTKAMINHDIYKSPNYSPAEFVESTSTNILLLVSTQDHLVNPNPSREFAKHDKIEFDELTADSGHLSIFYESDKIRTAIATFLSNEN